MIKRIRDVVRGTKPLERISQEDWDDIQSRANKAREFMSSENPIFLLLEEALSSASTIIIEDRIHDVSEERTITKNFKKIFFTPKEDQVKELVGQVKFIKDIKAELNIWIVREQDILEKMALNLIQIEDGRDK